MKLNSRSRPWVMITLLLLVVSIFIQPQIKQKVKVNEVKLKNIKRDFVKENERYQKVSNILNRDTASFPKPIDVKKNHLKMVYRLVDLGKKYNVVITKMDLRGKNLADPANNLTQYQSIESLNFAFTFQAGNYNGIQGLFKELQAEFPIIVHSLRVTYPQFDGDFDLLGVNPD